MTAEPHASIRTIARRAGGLYLSLLPLGVFSFVYVPSVLFVRGDADATSQERHDDLAQLLVKGVSVERWHQLAIAPREGMVHDR